MHGQAQQGRRRAAHTQGHTHTHTHTHTGTHTHTHRETHTHTGRHTYTQGVCVCALAGKARAHSRGTETRKTAPRHSRDTATLNGDKRTTDDEGKGTNNGSKGTKDGGKGTKDGGKGTNDEGKGTNDEEKGMKNQRNGNGTTCTHVAWLEREARRRRNEPPDPFLRERPEENLLAAATDIVPHTT